MKLLSKQARKQYSVAQIAKAWSPFLILTAMVTIWSIKPFKDLFVKDGPLSDLVVSIKVPYLHQLIQKLPPVVPEIKDYDAIYKFDWLSATGTAIILAALITIIYLNMKPKEAVSTFFETVNELKPQFIRLVWYWLLRSLQTIQVCQQRLL